MGVQDNKTRFGEALVAGGVVTKENLARGLELQKETGGYLVDVLIENELVDERRALRFLAETSGARYITSDKLAVAKIPSEALDRIPVRHAEKMGVLPLGFQPHTNTLTLALAEIDEGLLEQVRLAAGVGQIQPIIASRWAVRAGIKRYYHGDIYAFAQYEDSQARGEVVVVEDAPPEVQVRAPARREPAPKAPEGDLEKLKREVALLRTSTELVGHLAKERDAQAILHRVLAFAFDKLPADEAALLLPDRGGTFTPRGVRTKTDAKSIRVSDTLVQEILRERQGVLTSDAKSDERFNKAESVILTGVRSAIGVPILVGKEVRAVLVLATKERVDVFTRYDLDVLLAIAAQATLSLEVAENARQLASDAANRAQLARYLSPALVEQIASGVLGLSATGEAHEVTLLFADISGFTDLAEQLGPRDVVALLNEHFAQMAEIVFFHGGMLDKYVGDAIMAVFGAPLRNPQAPAKALRAALEMQGRVSDMNALRGASGKPQFQVAIGVHTGWVIFGSMGSARRQDLTVLGDTVATAQKLCAAAQPGQILASEVALAASQGAFAAEHQPDLALSGRAANVRAFLVKEELPKGG
ncbi:MAG: GAF domain-containing protein [Deltaproteobacteria bacterium]|nr:GAF domain-containing protein [Deltaproteobacteria bacterium]